MQYTNPVEAAALINFVITLLIATPVVLFSLIYALPAIVDALDNLIDSRK